MRSDVICLLFVCVCVFFLLFNNSEPLCLEAWKLIHCAQFFSTNILLCDVERTICGFDWRYHCHNHFSSQSFADLFWHLSQFISRWKIWHKKSTYILLTAYFIFIKAKIRCGSFDLHSKMKALTLNRHKNIFARCTDDSQSANHLQFALFIWLNHSKTDFSSIKNRFMIRGEHTAKTVQRDFEDRLHSICNVDAYNRAHARSQQQHRHAASEWNPLKRFRAHLCTHNNAAHCTIHDLPIVATKLSWFMKTYIFEWGESRCDEIFSSLLPAEPKFKSLNSFISGCKNLDYLHDMNINDRIEL